MAEKLDEKELVSFKEMLIEKGIITEGEFYAKLKEVQREYGKIKG